MVIKYIHSLQKGILHHTFTLFCDFPCYLQYVRREEDLGRGSEETKEEKLLLVCKINKLILKTKDIDF